MPVVHIVKTILQYHSSFAFLLDVVDVTVAVVLRFDVVADVEDPAADLCKPKWLKRENYHVYERNLLNSLRNVHPCSCHKGVVICSKKKKKKKKRKIPPE